MQNQPMALIYIIKNKNQLKKPGLAERGRYLEVGSGFARRCTTQTRLLIILGQR